MAKFEPIIKVNTTYKVVFFPIASSVNLGEIYILNILGVTVYRRLGDIKSLFGYTWGQNNVA